MGTKKKRIHTIPCIRAGDLAILCEGGHLKVSAWTLTYPSGKNVKIPHLYPVGNWRLLEPAARAWLYRSAVSLQEGECAICPHNLTLEEMLG